jgi:demethylmenaquinone methyltransferase/2-methoxy-6-polyprenyl-1,4-benzoquinol methylase
VNGPRQEGVRSLFDENAATYDRVNSVISLGLDARWREWAARKALVCEGARVLDAFAGTGLVGLRAAELGARVTLADMSPGMLAVARRRADSRGTEVEIAQVDLTSPSVVVPGAPFDAVTVVFGVRYLDDPPAVLRNLSRLLVAGGRLVTVEFVEPGRSPVSAMASAYFFGVLPAVAGALAGHRELYDRLAASTHEMDGAQRLIGMVAEAGLRVAEVRTMGFGMVCGLVALS